MLIQADARRIPLVDGCVQCCVSSPPYFNLRDYNIAGQIGLEPSPDAYVAALVGVYMEVWRVLADDGCIWVNLGDSYAAGGHGGGGVFMEMRGKSGSEAWAHRQDKTGWRKPPDGLKPKDLIGIPWRVAFALQADGWYLRSDVIWSKPNPMPESVTDRPTKAHEYVFLFSKSERYYYDADAIADPLSDVSIGRYQRAVDNKEVFDPARHKHAMGDKKIHQAPMEILTRAAANVVAKGTRNARSVWMIPTQPYAGAHFATMPEKLAERCILAGSRPGDLVLDPFGGSGTTVRVARRFNRRGVMLDLNPAYLQLAQERISGVQTDIFEVPA